jgi:hypothetical protein
MTMTDLGLVYKDHILDKARELVDTERAVQQDASDTSVWWVKGSQGSKYRCQILQPYDPDADPDEAPTTAQLSAQNDKADIPLLSCTCPNGMNRGGRPTCYHTAAVLLMLGDMEAGREPAVMTDPNPLNEDFVGDDGVQALRDQGYTDDEIAFLRG